MLHLFSTRGRTTRLNFFWTILFAQAAVVGVILAETTFRSQFAPESYFLLVAATAVPFALIQTCTTIRRLQDLNWSWHASVPLVPLYFWPVWAVLIPDVPVNLAVFALGFSALFLVVLLVSRGTVGPNTYGPEAISDPQPVQPPAQPEPAYIHCPNGHDYPAPLYPRCPYCPLPMPAATPITPPPSPSVAKVDPVVGWLVVIDGPGRGKEYRLFARRNRIGRDVSMEVQLADDAVQPFEHASVTYDAASNTYTLFPGAGPIELGGLPITGPVSLSPFDRLRVGRTALIVAVVCGPEYQWDFASAPDLPSGRFSPLF